MVSTGFQWFLSIFLGNENDSFSIFSVTVTITNFRAQFVNFHDMIKEILRQTMEGGSKNNLGALIMVYNLLSTTNIETIPFGLIQSALFHYNQDISPPSNESLVNELTSKKLPRFLSR